MVWSAGEGREGAVEREGAGRLRMVTELRRGENLLCGEPYRGRAFGVKGTTSLGENLLCGKPYRRRAFGVKGTNRLAGPIYLLLTLETVAEKLGEKQAP